MAYKTCPDCGCRIYSGYCTNCHEEHYIYEQDQMNSMEIENYELTKFSPEFMDKVKEQEEIAKERREEERRKEREKQYINEWEIEKELNDKYQGE